MGSKNKDKLAAESFPAQEAKEGLPHFTGVARSIECYLHNGFNNFRIVRLAIEDGQVISRTESDPFASFEVIARMEIECQDATLNLNGGYENGKAWKK